MGQVERIKLTFEKLRNELPWGRHEVLNTFEEQVLKELEMKDLLSALKQPGDDEELKQSPGFVKQTEESTQWSEAHNQVEEKFPPDNIEGERQKLQRLKTMEQVMDHMRTDNQKLVDEVNNLRATVAQYKATEAAFEQDKKEVIQKLQAWENDLIKSQNKAEAELLRARIEIEEQKVEFVTAYTLDILETIFSEKKGEPITEFSVPFGQYPTYRETKGTGETESNSEKAPDIPWSVREKLKEEYKNCSNASSPNTEEIPTKTDNFFEVNLSVEEEERLNPEQLEE